MAEVAVAEPLAVYRSGPQEGIPLLLLHAFPFDAQLWEQVDMRMPDVPAVLVDAPGFGDSPAFGLVAAAVGRSPNSSIDTYADAVVASLLREGIERAVVVGHSMGGYVALSLAERYEHLVAGLGLIDTKASADDEEGVANRLRIADEAEESGAKAVAPMVKKLLGKTTQSMHPELVAEVRGLLAAAPAEGISWAQRAMARRPDRLEVLKGLEVPALVLRGSEDELSSQEAAEEMAAALKDCELEVVPEVGHLSVLEDPDAVTAAVHRLWERSQV